MWQPIETAPKDMTRIILAKYSRRPTMLVWVTEDGWDDEEGEWCDKPTLDPTHWMPIPEDPPE